jgi:hypothetical protein
LETKASPEELEALWKTIIDYDKENDFDDLKV